METEVIRIGPAGIRGQLARITKIFESGGIVAFPTETVYGLAVRADHQAAVARLRELKSRSASQALTVHIASPGDYARFVHQINRIGERLIRKAWPGPLTLIVPVDNVTQSPIFRSGFDKALASVLYYDGSVGLRCPDDDLARSIIAAVPAPVVATSANRTGEPPATSAEPIIAAFSGVIDLVVDGGRCRYAQPSTIVRLEGDGYQFVRTGALDERMISDLATTRILFVCTGNTCRSPMAAGLARHLLAQKLSCRPKDLASRGIAIESAGISPGSGGAAPNAIAALSHLGVDLSGHVVSGLSREMLQRADHIFVMTRGHLASVVDLSPSVRDKVRLLLDQEDLFDPVGGDENAYETCAKKIEGVLGSRLLEIGL